MFGIIHFETFALAALLLIITPGNDMIFILTRSITQGKKAGIISAIGVGTGSTIHTSPAALWLVCYYRKINPAAFAETFTRSVFQRFPNIISRFSNSTVTN